MKLYKKNGIDLELGSLRKYFILNLTWFWSGNKSRWNRDRHSQTSLYSLVHLASFWREFTMLLKTIGLTVKMSEGGNEKKW